MWMALKRAFVVLGGFCFQGVGWRSNSNLRPLPTNATGQLNIFWHYGHSLGMDSAQVGVFKETYKISLTCFLQSHNSRTLKTQICLEILRDFSN